MTTENDPFAAFIKNAPANTDEASVESTPAKEDDYILPVAEDFIETPVVKVQEFDKLVTEQNEVKSNSKIVIFSMKDISVKGIGKLDKGYTKVSEKDAEKWLKYNSVRLAGSEEIKTYFNK